MPYNGAAVLPSGEPTGTTQLPFSRVRKIVLVDNDIHILASAGTFAITLATEMFIQYLAEQAHNVVKSERKPRRNIQYRDLSMAVASHDNLEFLVDVVPKTVPFKQAKEKKPASAVSNTNGDASVEIDQPTLIGKNPMLNGINGHARSGAGGDGKWEDDAVSDPTSQLQIDRLRARTSNRSFNNSEISQQDIEMQ